MSIFKSLFNKTHKSPIRTVKIPGISNIICLRIPDSKLSLKKHKNSGTATIELADVLLTSLGS